MFSFLFSSFVSRAVSVCTVLMQENTNRMGNVVEFVSDKLQLLGIYLLNLIN